ncbi:MAG: NACHT domain-containing protein [Actinomycetota bacterium]|nr:NACHT domain-containing protein [Actinomycetota bacterium]
MALAETDLLQAALRGDLAAFADPGEEVRVEQDGDDSLIANWLSGGRAMKAMFRLGSETSLSDASVELEGKHLSYRAFLAGAGMADLRAVARNTVAVLSSNEAFVAPRADAGSGPTSADGLLDELTTPSDGGTPVVFLTASAGDGKTTLLKRLAADRAHAFLQGRDDRVWLYVDAQGSRLARLDQALARALDDVRAPFSYHATASLVRVGALVLVIDGFDELIGTTGSYDEAYSSLSSYIEQLAGHGAVVAAARSAYYDQEFASRANRSAGFSTNRWELYRVRLLDWNEDERELFVRRLAREHNLEYAAERLHQQVEEAFADQQLQPLAGKPLFVRGVAEFVLEGRTLAGGDNALERLVTTYVEREVSQKLLAPTGALLISAETLGELLGELAQEMWREEARSLSRTTARELVALFGELRELDGDTIATLAERLPYVALIREAGAPGAVAFEHELFFAYFLVRPLVEARGESAFLLAQTLRRGRLPHDAAWLAGRELRAHVNDLLARLGQVGTDAPTPVVRENAGSVALGALDAQNEVSDLNIRHVDFIDADCRSLRLSHSRLVDVQMVGCDLRGAQLVECRADAVRARDVLLDGSALLELEGLAVAAVSSLVFYSSDGDAATLYAPADIRRVLAEVGVPSAQRGANLRQVDLAVVELLQQLFRVYERTNLLTEQDDNAVRQVVRNRSWPSLREALLSSGVLAEEKRPAGGNKTFLRSKFLPEDVLAGQDKDAEVPEDVRTLWRLLEERVPARG